MEKKEKTDTYNKLRRIVAMLTVFIIVALILLTLIFAFIGNRWFWVFLFLMLFVPVVLWVFMWIFKVTNDTNEEND